MISKLSAQRAIFIDDKAERSDSSVFSALYMIKCRNNKVYFIVVYTVYRIIPGGMHYGRLNFLRS
jgi:hypothetical protein